MERAENQSQLPKARQVVEMGSRMTTTGTVSQGALLNSQKSENEMKDLSVEETQSEDLDVDEQDDFGDGSDWDGRGQNQDHTVAVKGVKGVKGVKDNYTVKK